MLPEYIAYGACKQKRDAVLRARTTVGFLSLPPLLVPRQETPRLGARVTHFEARKPRFRGAETWRHPPLRGVENSLRRVKNLSRGGGVPLGCPPWVDFFRRIFDRKKSYAEFLARRSAFFAARIRCRLFQPKNVFSNFFAHRSAFFAQFFARFSSRFPRPVWRPRGRPPRSPPWG